MKRSENLIPVVRRLVTSENGENYWFNACAAYAMECLGERDHDYWFFAGLTGDNFVQHYKFGFRGDGVSAYHEFDGDGQYFEDIFAKCGYEASYIPVREMAENREEYLRKIIDCIDRGIPVISLGGGDRPMGVYAGYRGGGETLLYISGDSGELRPLSADIALDGKADRADHADACVFVGEKRRSVPLAELYRGAISALPKLMTAGDNDRRFGAAAFRKWAEDIESGIFDNINPEDYDDWGMYKNFVCVLATNGSCCFGFLDKALELNPDMTFLKDVGELYRKTGAIWGELEDMGAGLNVTLEYLKDREKRGAAAEKLRELESVAEDILRVLEKGLPRI